MAQLVNKPASKLVAEAAKAFGDHNWDVPKLLASSATGIAWRFWQLPSIKMGEEPKTNANAGEKPDFVIVVNLRQVL